MDPSGGWGQNRGLQGGWKAKNNGEKGNLGLQEGELPKSSLYCLLSRRQAPQGQGSLQELNGGEAAIKHKRKLIMVKHKEGSTCIGSWAATLHVS